MIRILARNLLATVQTAVASGAWIMGGDCDPTNAIERLERCLDMGGNDSSVQYHYDMLADAACEAAANGQWPFLDADAVNAIARLTPANDAVTAMSIAA